MVGGKHYFVSGGGNVAEHLYDCCMAKPRSCQAAVSGVGGGQFAYHLALCTGVRQHIYEVEHYDIEVIMEQIGEIAQQFFAGHRIIDLVVAEFVGQAITLKHGLYQRRLVDVFTLLRLFIHP